MDVEYDSNYIEKEKIPNLKNTPKLYTINSRRKLSPTNRKVKNWYENYQ
jgi:hypothetical protein